MIKVEISIYKPMGFADTHYVNTTDRGQAVKKVLGLYPDTQLKYLNGIYCKITSAPKEAKILEITDEVKE